MFYMFPQTEYDLKKVIQMGWIQDLRSAIADISNENDITENANMKGTGQEEKSDGIMK